MSGVTNLPSNHRSTTLDRLITSGLGLLYPIENIPGTFGSYKQKIPVTIHKNIWISFP